MNFRRLPFLLPCLLALQHAALAGGADAPYRTPIYHPSGYADFEIIPRTSPYLLEPESPVTTNLASEFIVNLAPTPLPTPPTLPPRPAYTPEQQAQIRYYYALSLANAGNLDEAAQQLEIAVQLSPRFVTALDQLGLAIAKKGEINRATTVLLRAIEIAPSSPLPHLHVAMIRMQEGKPADAIAHLRAALMYCDELPEAWNNLAWLLATCPEQNLRNGAEAVELATRYADFTGWQDPQALDTLAAAYAEAGRFRDAIDTSRYAFHLANLTGNSSLRAELQARLKQYEAEVPLRD